MRTIPQKESLTVEFKSDRSRLSDDVVVEVAVAFANTEGGTLYLGVEDDGSISGVLDIHKDTEGQVALVANKTVPPVRAEANLLKEEEKDVLALTVYKSRAIVSTSDGKMLRRRINVKGESENIPLYPHEIYTRLSSMNSLDYSDQLLLEGSIDDFDPAERKRLRSLIENLGGEKRLLDLSDDELDRALRFSREINGVVYPTVTGLLMIGKSERIKSLIPTAMASFQVLESGSVRFNEDGLFLPLLALFERFERNMKSFNSEREFFYGFQRIPLPEYSPIAFREALVNAFSHRDYTIRQAVRVLIDDEGLTITNPGGFIEGITLENLLTAEPHGRNLALSDAFKRIGLAERAGRGIDYIISSTIMNGKTRPDYSESTSREVRVFFSSMEADLPFAKMLREGGKSYSPLSLLILYTLRRIGPLSIKELAEELKFSSLRIETALEPLLNSSLIIRNGKKKLAIALESPKASDEDLDNAIIECIKRSGKASNVSIVNELGLTRSQVYWRLKKLVEEGKIIKRGEGKGTHYTLS